MLPALGEVRAGCSVLILPTRCALFFRMVSLKNKFSDRAVVGYRILLLLGIMTVMAVGLWRISMMAVLIIHQTIRLDARAKAGIPSTPADFAYTAVANVDSTREVVDLMNGILIASCVLFFMAGLYSLIQVGRAAKAGSSAMRKTGAGLFAFIAVEFIFSIPVIVNMYFMAGAHALSHVVHAKHRTHPYAHRALYSLLSPRTARHSLPTTRVAQTTTGCSGRTTPTPPGCGTHSRKGVS